MPAFPAVAVDHETAVQAAVSQAVAPSLRLAPAAGQVGGSRHLQHHRHGVADQDQQVAADCPRQGHLQAPPVGR
ncbi:MAG: hypothetical protein A2Y35_13830 [Spirochaetes bacterium GWE1_60_18]|nr:MAG: hypothetical protein A2Y35_13830 [Spirochaetes bacterium GWE1_60_18]